MVRNLLTLILLSLLAAPASANQRQTLFEIAQEAVEGFDGRDRSAVQQATWPDGFYVQVGNRGRGTLKRHWKDVPFGGVIYRTTFGAPVISVHGSRADIKVSYAVRTYYDVEGSPRACDGGIYHFDLRRRRGEWRVLNLTVRPHGRCSKEQLS